jgi:uncharacterized membrane protein YcaP (DUF421 family)
MEHLMGALQLLFGNDVPREPLSVLQMSGRAVLIYFAGLVIVRVGKDRLLGRSTAFDIVLGFILGSMLSRAINGTAALVGTVVAAVVLTTIHWLFARLALRFEPFATAVKGKRVVLIRDGEIQGAAMRSTAISERDLREALRLNAHLDDPSAVEMACLERNGRISILLPRAAT